MNDTETSSGLAGAKDLKTQQPAKHLWLARSMILMAALGLVAGTVVALAHALNERRQRPLRDEFLQNFRQVASGDSPDAVRSILGQPTDIYGPTNWTMPPDGFIGPGPAQLWTYAVAGRSYTVQFGISNPLDKPVKWNVVAVHEEQDDALGAIRVEVR